MMTRNLKYCKYDEESKVLLSTEPAAVFDEPSFPHFLLRAFDEHSGRRFMSEANTKKSANFEDVKKMSLQIASSLINRCKLGVGDVIFGYASSSIIYACTVYASIFAGLVFTGDTGVLTVVNIVPQLRNCGAKVVLCEENNYRILMQALRQCQDVHTVVLLDSPDEVDTSDCPPAVSIITMRQLMCHGSVEDPLLPRMQTSDPKKHLVFLPYSSGSTGMPKGVRRNAHSLMSMCYNLKGNGLFSGSSGDISIFHQSFGHMSGQTTLILSLSHGSHLIIMRSVTSETLLQTISEFRATASVIAPTMIQELAKADISGDMSASTLRTVTTGGAPLPPSVIDPFLRKMPTVKRFFNAYGLSEGPMATRTPIGCREYASVGSLIRGCELKVVHPDTGKVCSFNEVGEVWLRSEMSASGYLNRPDAERSTWTDDGWVKTGDAGFFQEEGLVYIVDRYKEMIKVHINQVAPAELQSLLCLHPEVSEACVVAVAHPLTGETPRAFVVPRDPKNLPDEEQVLRFVNDQVVEYRRINGGLYLVESLPKLVIGKVDRQLVRNNPHKLVYLNASRKLQ